jgi:hypothetical protein
MRYRPPCRRAAFALLAGATALAPAGAEAAPQRAPDQVRGRPSLSVLAAPSPVLASDGRRHLVYEIIATNATRLRVTFARVAVVDGTTGRTVAAYRTRGIARRMVAFPAARSATTLRPRGSGALFLDLTFAPANRIPSRLEHRFVFSVREGRGAARRIAVTAAATRVDRRAAVRLAPPLRGDRLLDGNGCCAGTDHIRAINLVEGRLFQAQRFAIDFVKVNPQGTNTFVGDRARNESYAIFGAEVLAVGPGRIVSVRNDAAENIPPNEPDVPANDLNQAAGNYVVQALGAGRFALYAHLQPGSVRVSPGQTVQREQVLGLVGNTGSSSEPHLHFHVMDRPSPLAANGLPYVFDAFRLEARVPDLATPQLVPLRPPQARAGQLPLTGDVVAFP